MHRRFVLLALVLCGAGCGSRSLTDGSGGSSGGSGGAALGTGGQSAPDASATGGSDASGEAAADASADADIDTATPMGMAPPIGDWVWKSAAPVVGFIEGIWAFTPDDAWAVGDNGLAMHWDGKAWLPVASNTKNHLSGIWGAGARDIWAVAGGVGGEGAFNLIHWDGQSWSPVSADTDDNLAGVWGTSAHDVWAVGGSGVEGVITHFDGVAWHVVFTTPFSNLAGVWGSGPSDIWVAGFAFGIGAPDGNNSLLHWNGSVWSRVAENAPNNQAKVLTSVWEASTGEAWAAGYGSILHWDGTAWAPSVSGPYFNRIWGRAPNDVWAAGAGVVRFNGASWINQSVSNVGFHALGGTSAAAGGHEGIWAGGLSLFEFVPGSPLTCQAIGGTCGGACAPGQGHPSGYWCEDGAQCCVSPFACGGAGEPVCCSIADNKPIPELRPICTDGVFYCAIPGAAVIPHCGRI